MYFLQQPSLMIHTNAKHILNPSNRDAVIYPPHHHHHHHMHTQQTIDPCCLFTINIKKGGEMENSFGEESKPVRHRPRNWSPAFSNCIYLSLAPPQSCIVLC
jgi:hypothetical protein